MEESVGLCMGDAELTKRAFGSGATIVVVNHPTAVLGSIVGFELLKDSLRSLRQVAIDGVKDRFYVFSADVFHIICLCAGLLLL